MQSLLLRVVSSGEMISVKSEKSENGVLNKRILVLQELGGKYENCYVVTVLGNLASLTFEKDESRRESTMGRCLWTSWQRK